MALEMLTGGRGKEKPASLIDQYSAFLGDAVLRHRTRAAEHRARLEAELANRVKSEFISNMSHELRTPLNTVMGFSKLLTEHQERPLANDDIVQYAGLIHDAATHLLAVVNDILDISKMCSGNYSLTAQEIDLHGVLRRCINDYAADAAEAGLKLSPRIATSLPPMRGDALKFAQALGNIVSNAIKFTPKGGEVILEALEHGSGGIIISVRDTGIGMCEDEIRVALEPFGQVDGRKTRWREGTGLGLPIAKALFELHGGSFYITSVKGRGTDVSVILPPAHHLTLAEARDAVFGHAPPL